MAIAKLTLRKKDSQRDDRLGERAYQAIKEGILTLAYPPGSQLIDAELAERIGVSRTPVREALVRLAGEGFVRIIPHRGAYVTTLQGADLRGIYEMIDALECQAMELIADRRRAGTILHDDLIPLLRHVEGMEDALKTDDRNRWIECNEQFHLQITTYIENPYLKETLLRFRDLSQRMARLALQLRPKPERSTADHRAVANAIFDGDGERARRIHHEHERWVRGELQDILERNGLI